ncbi:transcriptional regulator domain-containing protein [Sphingobium herbicidovorans]
MLVTDMAMVNWEDPGAYAAIEPHGRSGLAWEVLRRDPAYRAAYSEIAPGKSAADGAFVARWGLHFR